MSQTTEHRVFVANVAYATSQEQFKSFMESVSGVVSSQLIFNNGNSRGFGYVTMDSQTSVDSLVGRDDLKLGERQLRFNVYSPRTSQHSNDDSNCQVFVGGLPVDVTKEELSSLFANDGVDVSSVRLFKTRPDATSSAAMVEFGSVSDRDTVLGWDNVCMGSNALRVREYRSSHRRPQNNNSSAYQRGYHDGLREGREGGQ